MKSKLNNFYWRLRYLITRKLIWKTSDGEIDEVEKVDFKTAWRLFGIHSWQWGWVKRYGTLECGCTRNPITRRMVSYVWRCPVHMTFGWDES